MTLLLPSPHKPLRIGTRGSPLALAQAHEARDRLAAAFELPESAFEIAVIKTAGDRVIDRPLKDIGGKGLFTREIEEGLLNGVIDIAVHSMKDVPVEQDANLCLDCYLPREDERDALVSHEFSSLQDMTIGAVVGTSSLRRKAQLLNRRPDLNIVEFRGNVQTRLRKLENGVAQATLLAMAGLNRLALNEVPRTPVDSDDMLPAVAQGAIGIERRREDTRMAGMLEAVHDGATGQRLRAERAFLEALDGSCQTPIACLAELDGGSLRLRGEILRVDGSEALADDVNGAVEDGAEMGRAAAAGLLARAGKGFFGGLYG